jgi:hypothetical protein
MIQSIDFLPTLAAVAGAKLPANQKFDGRSYLPVLRGEATEHRDTIFTFFPHNTPASSQLPACAVRRGDWKLIRYFHDGPKQEHRYELYNLRDDLSETKNLADAQPVRLKELDALIEGFLKDTAAVVPGPNPAYGTTAAAPTDRLGGWKARGCDVVVKEGILTMSGKNASPFLGFAGGKTAGPAVMKLRARTATGGDGKIERLPSGVATKTGDAESIPFTLKAGEWQEVSVDVPAQGPLGILRVYLPAQKQPVELDWIELQARQTNRRWEFNDK